MTVSRDKFGDYYRPLAPGRYTVVVSCEGYKPLSINLTIPEDGSGAQRHFLLAPESSSGSSEVSYSLRMLAQPGEVGSVLPWKAARAPRRSSAEAGISGGAEPTTSRGRDRLLMLGAGAATVYGLLITHRRLQRKSLRRIVP